MNSFFRIGLPIFLVVVLVGGITVVQLYSPDDAASNLPGDNQGGAKVAAAEPPLKFPLIQAIAPEGESLGRLTFLKYWDPSVEVGAPGHYEFWCENRHPQPVTIRVPTTNCQCAGVELAVPTPDTIRDYAILSALAGGPLCPAAAPASAVAHALFDSRLTWLPLHNKDGKPKDEKPDQTIPPADPATGPRMALVRLGWSGKGEAGPKVVSAQVYASIGNAPPVHTQIGVQAMVVPAFDVMRQDGPGQWTPTRELIVGNLRENGVFKQTVLLISTTRLHPLYSATMDPPDPCVTWTKPVPAAEEELLALRAHLVAAKIPLQKFRSLHKMEITIRERVEEDQGGKKVLHQLDLGPFDRRIVVTGAEAGSQTIVARGHVLGDITVQGGADGGRIDLGSSFPADQDRVKSVTLVAERLGFDLALLDAEVFPNYMKVKLEAIQPLPDGRKQWRLQVTIPKNQLYGGLPEGSVVVLQTNGPSPRRLRIPVRGMSFVSGGPRL